MDTEDGARLCFRSIGSILIEISLIIDFRLFSCFSWPVVNLTGDKLAGDLAGDLTGDLAGGLTGDLAGDFSVI